MLVGTSSLLGSKQIRPKNAVLVHVCSMLVPATVVVFVTGASVMLEVGRGLDVLVACVALSLQPQKKPGCLQLVCWCFGPVALVDLGADDVEVAVARAVLGADFAPVNAVEVDQLVIGTSFVSVVVTVIVTGSLHPNQPGVRQLVVVKVSVIVLLL